ncbi:MAG: EcsC family protein [Gammaproteobacteria bacterium]|nr:EcsC family protein [Gammaproteobacteria bacterium]
MVKTSDSTTDRADIRSLPVALDQGDLADLRRAFDTLEHPSLAARISNVVGTPIEIVAHLLPKRWYRRIHDTAEKAITTALESAISTLRRDHENSANEVYYRGLAAGSGAIGGFFGLPGLVVELPVTTTLMLRGIAEIARSEGEDLDAIESRMACVQVFALGGKSESDDAAETGYYGVRLAMSGYVTSLTAEVARHGIAAEGGPLALQLVQAVAGRFGVVVSQRAALQIIPIASAISTATINTIFMQHFQSMARAHFTVRRLERKYEPEFVRGFYENFRQEQQA